uniref:Taste receptor type 2 n=1 Tax=Pyxicephalus adspersus TaxID=30357 RepID=A0AAV2ZMI1_PYXAD|nr:TPA: hypothetical protein GDO54_004411 [Pyxicephalus adspersus]
MSSLAFTVFGIHCILIVTGLSGNIFILIVHLLDWLKTREHNPCNIIINSIGTSNIILQGAVSFQEICFFISPKLFSQVWVSFLIIGIMTSLTLSSLWCATCLCFYYCVKITNINRFMLYKLKAKLAKVVPWLIFFSVVLSWSSGMPAYWDLYFHFSLISGNKTGNVTMLMFYRNGSRCNCFFEMSIFLASFAFAIIILTGGAIITSLCRHMSRMRQNNESWGQSRIQTHLSAVRTVTSLLVLYLVFFIIFTILSNPTSITDDVTITVGFIVVACFPTLNSIILILGNRKPLNTVKKILGMKASMTNTNVSVITHD